MAITPVLSCGKCLVFLLALCFHHSICAAQSRCSTTVTTCDEGTSTNFSSAEFSVKKVPKAVPHFVAPRMDQPQTSFGKERSELAANKFASINCFSNCFSLFKKERKEAATNEQVDIN